MNPSARTSLFAGAVLIVALAATVRSPAPPIEPPLELPPVVEPPDVPIRVADLRTVADPRPDPVPLTLAGRERQLSAASLIVDHLDNAGGRGRLTLDERPHTFNEYGDGTPTAGPPPTEYAVRLGRPEFYNHGLLCDVTFDPVDCPDKLKLYLDPEPADEHRLVRLPADWAWNNRSNPLWVLPLRPTPLPADPLPPLPLSPVPTWARYGLTTLVRDHRRNPDERHADPYRVSVSGKPPDDGMLAVELNYLFVGPDWRAHGGSCVEYPEFRIRFRPLGPDPLGRGRQAYALDLADAHIQACYERRQTRPVVLRRYTLVRTGDDRGPHRLVVWDGEAISQVLPLTDVSREQRLFVLRKRSDLPPDERAAVERLAAVSGPKFELMTHKRRVWAITVAGDVDRLTDDLSALPALTHLSVTDGRLPATGFRGLERLSKLSSVSFTGEISDAGLASLLSAPRLQTVQLHATRGLSADGLRPLARLPRLLLAQIGLPPGGNADAALIELSKSPVLQQVQLSGGRPTDAGLTAVRRLRRLTVLTLWNADRVTPAGLWALDGLPDLRQIYLFGADLPADAVKAFTARNPRVQVTTKPFR